MFKRVGALALILSAAAILQPATAFAQDRYDGRHGDRGYYHERDRGHDRREWREHERREWREDHHYRDYDRGWRYRDGRAFYFGAGPSYGYYENAPAPYYPVDPYYYGR